MTISAIARFCGDAFKSAIYPAAFVAAGSTLPQFTEAATASKEALFLFGENYLKDVASSFSKATKLSRADLSTFVERLPTHVEAVWAKHSQQMTTAAVWGLTTTLTNTALHKAGIGDRKRRIVASLLTGAVTSAVFSQVVLGETATPHLYIDTAIKAATLASPFILSASALDTAVGLTGASASLLTKFITITCRTTQIALRALWLPGTPTYINAPKGEPAPSADERTFRAIALWHSAVHFARTCDTRVRSMELQLRAQYPDFSDSEIEAIANQAKHELARPFGDRAIARRPGGATAAAATGTDDAASSSEDD